MVPLTQAVIALQSPFVRYDTSWTNPTVYRTQDGLCFMEGLIRRSDNAAFGGGLLAVLPVGFRPSDRTLLNGVSNADGAQLLTRLDVDPDGSVTFQAAAASPVWLSMTGRWYVSAQTWLQL